MKTPEARRERPPSPIRTRARTKVLCAAIFATLSCGSAHAVEINYQFELQGLHSNNLNLSEDNQAPETVLIPRLRFDVKQQGSAVKLQARGMVERVHYMDNTFPDETRGEFAGQLNWTLFPGRMNFVAEDYYSLEPISIRDGRYPGNLQQINVFLAGPTFFARMGDVTRLQVDLRGADSNAQVTRGLTSRRYSAAAALQRELSSTSRVSINLEGSKAKFDVPTVVDYTLKQGFVRYEHSFTDGLYEIDLGRSRLDRDLAPDASTTIARATLQWQPDPRNRFRLRARQEFTDDVEDLVVRLSDPEEALIPDLADSAAASPGVYRGRLAELDYRFSGDRLVLRLRPRYARKIFIDFPQNNRVERGVFMSAEYRLRPRLTLFVQGLEQKREFLTQEERVDRDHVYSLGVNYQMTRHLSWEAEVDRNVRDSNLSDPRYRENAVQFTIIWKR
jgi:hypothetical protein